MMGSKTPAASSPASQHSPALVRVCAVCRREFRGADADDRAAAHWAAQHIGQSVDVELVGARVFGVATAVPVIELHDEKRIPKLKHEPKQ